MPEKIERSGRKGTGHVGIREVAERAGVGKTTAAYILNSEKAHRFSEDTRRRVHEAAEILGYSPNIFARGLKTGRSALIGIYFGDFGAPDLRSGGWNTFFVRFFGGFCGAALQRGIFPVTMLRGPDHPVGDKQRLGKMIHSGIGGMVTYRATTDVANYLLDQSPPGFPMISIFGGFPQDAPVIDIDVDNEAIGRLATEHLIRGGYRRIVAARDQPFEECSRLRIEGYKKAMAKAGLEPHIVVFPSLLVYPDEATFRRMDAETRSIIEQTEADSYFCLTAGAATLAARSLMDMGRLDADITGLVGVDVMLAPNGVTFTQLTAPWADIAEKAFNLIEQIMSNGQPVIGEQVLIPPALYQGHTTHMVDVMIDQPVHFQDFYTGSQEHKNLGR